MFEQESRMINRVSTKNLIGDEYSDELAASRRALLARVAEIEDLYDAAPQGMALIDANRKLIRMNRRMAEFCGLSPDTPTQAYLGVDVSMVLFPFTEQIIAPIAHVLHTGEAISNLEMHAGNQPIDGKRSDGQIFEADWYPVRSSRNVDAVGLMLRDVTHQRHTEQELHRVMQELQHRVKNSLASVIALVNQARRSPQQPQQALDTLADRVKALAQTQSLLTDRNWRSADLLEIVTPELVPVFGGARASVSGPSIELNAKAALAFSMAIHELATNALKYGSLAHHNGKISLDWHISSGKDDCAILVMNWREIGAQNVKEPTRLGFGLRLIDSSIGGTLGGTITRTFRPEGLVVEITADLKRITEVEEQSSFQPQ